MLPGEWLTVLRDVSRQATGEEAPRRSENRLTPRRVQGEVAPSLLPAVPPPYPPEFQPGDVANNVAIPCGNLAAPGAVDPVQRRREPRRGALHPTHPGHLHRPIEEPAAFKPLAACTPAPSTPAATSGKSGPPGRSDAVRCRTLATSQRSAPSPFSSRDLDTLAIVHLRRSVPLPHPGGKRESPGGYFTRRRWQSNAPRSDYLLALPRHISIRGSRGERTEPPHLIADRTSHRVNRYSRLPRRHRKGRMRSHR